MADTPYEPGLHRLSDATSTYLQPDGGFGLSNAGVVHAGGDVLLVDTFFDLAHTRALLDAVGEAWSLPRRVVNTHDNGDHCWGNQLCAGAEIIGHRFCAEDMGKVTPQVLGMLAAAPPESPLARYLTPKLARFDFTGIEITPPTTVFDDELVLDVGGTEVRLAHVGPAHTRGDVVVHVPAEGVVFCGDILFRLCAPLGWEGSTDNWIRALEHVAALDVSQVVPGHGPVCGPEGALELRDYFVYVRDEARERFERGVPLLEAAAGIDLGPYASWAESERVVSIVARNYREFGSAEEVDLLGLIRAMSQWHAPRRSS